MTGNAYKQMWLLRYTADRYFRVKGTICPLAGGASLVLPAYTSWKKDIDGVGKVLIKIILVVHYSEYKNAIKLSGILRPTDQWAKITKCFVAKSAKHNNFSKWLQPLTTNTC